MMEQPQQDDNEAQGLHDRLDHIRSSPNLQSQKHSFVILSAVEDTLKEQGSDFTPTAYFAALLSLLNQYVSPGAGIANKETATAIVYLLDLVTPYVPRALLRSKFSQILSSLAPALGHSEVEAPFLRAAIGCLVSLLLVQDSQAWNLPQTEIGPRRALVGLLSLASDHRPKVRKRALSGLADILQKPPPSPSLDHPAADMCAETALQPFEEAAGVFNKSSNQNAHRLNSVSSEFELIRAMQLIKTIASSCGGWPSRSLEPLSEVLLSLARSKNELLTVSAFDVFEVIFAGMANQNSLSKLPRLLEAITDLEPPQTDAQLFAPWLAIISRGYNVLSQLDPDATFSKLPILFKHISQALASPAYNIRVSASECLTSLLSNCVPSKAVTNPSARDKEAIQDLCQTITGLLSVKYQSSWMEVFKVLAAAFAALKYQSIPGLAAAITTVGELRGQDTFAGKSEADAVLTQAIQAVGAEAFLSILPLNLQNPSSGEHGRAWLIPLLRDSVRNDRLSHFKQELLPLSEQLFQRVLDQSTREKSMETKIFETLIQQIWDCLPGYCDLPTDLTIAFDQQFAEMLCNLLYQKPEMRTTICRSLQNLVESSKVILEPTDPINVDVKELTADDARNHINHLASFAPNLLAVLFNIYTQTASQQRGSILECIDSYLSITNSQEISETFNRVATMLDSSMKDSLAQEKPLNDVAKEDSKSDMMLALMDIVVTIATYLPRESFQSLFTLALVIIRQKESAQLQKKAYKLLPRLAQSATGKIALQERQAELRQMLLNNTDNVLAAARRDRLKALTEIVKVLPAEDLHFVAAILPEIILSTKETGERSRYAAFDLIMLIGEKMQAGGVIDNNKLNPAQSDGAVSDSTSTNASIEEYMTMLSAGLAGTTPHMISASVTAITRVFYAYHALLSEATTSEMLSTMDLFLKSPSREVVRSVLGFVKVAILSLPVPFMASRLQTLIPNLMPWSHERKGHFKAKVKNILERMIRRFGVEAVERYCPVEDRRLVANIRKTRDRRKRGKPVDLDAADDEISGPAAKGAGSNQARYNNEFDEAIYGSESDQDDNEQESEMDSDDASAVRFRGGKQGKGRSAGRKRNQATTYIREDSDEPLDLLDRKSLGNISSEKPTRPRDVERRRHASKAKTDEDGKFVFDEFGDDDDEAMADANADGGLERGINAYVDAIRGRDAAKRGQRGRLKFSNKREKDMDVEDPGDGSQQQNDRTDRGRGERGRARGRGFAGRGQISPRGRGAGNMRRGGFGAEKRGRGVRGGGRGGRVQKRQSFGRRGRL